MILLNGCGTSGGRPIEFSIARHKFSYLPEQPKPSPPWRRKAVLPGVHCIGSNDASIYHVISEYEVRQRIADLGLANFIVLPFNIDDAIATARVFDVMHAARQPGDGRDAVKDDAKLLGQCVVSGVTHFATDDEPCARRITAARGNGTINGLPHAISLHEPFWAGWFSDGNQGSLQL